MLGAIEHRTPGVAARQRVGAGDQNERPVLESSASTGQANCAATAMHRSVRVTDWAKLLASSSNLLFITSPSFLFFRFALLFFPRGPETL